jgi:class 3 adenylate cyclase
LGPLQVRQHSVPVAIPGAKPRAILTMLGLHGGWVVSADTLVELLWGDDPPRTAGKALQTHISSLRRTLGDGFILTEGAGWALAATEVDASRYKAAARLGRDAAMSGDTSQAVASFEEALSLWRGVPELPDGQRGASERTRWLEAHAALVEDRADALLATGRAAEIIGELEAAVADAPLRERRWGQLMLALYRAGRQGEALGAYQRARSLLADQLGVDPGPDLRRLEAAVVGQDAALDMPVAQQLSSVTRTVTFLLTDIEGSTAAWEADSDAMAVALARHDELVEQVVTSRGGRLIKTRGEGDATFSVFERPSAAAAAAIELQDAIIHEPWTLREPLRIRVALHTGEVELRDGDYFGRAVNRAARLRSLASGGQILCSGATAELVIDSLRDDVVLADLGVRQLRNLARPEHVFELRMQSADEERQGAEAETVLQRPDLPAVLVGPGPFVGRVGELERLSSTWQTALAGGVRAVLIAGEPGVGKTRLAGEWSRHAHEQKAVVLYGRCDEDLGAPYQPFAEALRSIVGCLGADRIRGLRGVEALLPLVPGLKDVLPDLAAPTRADPDTERYALFDAVVALLGAVSSSAPVVLVLDDLHWAAKSTLLLLRHLLRFGEQTRVQVVGTYRSTDLDRSHPLAAMLADLHRDGTADRLSLSGLHEDDVSAYVAEAGYDDEELARALASVTGGNPFFLIEALRHVDESGGRWDPSTLPQGVREAVSRRLSRLPSETNKALAAAAVVGSRFALEFVERVTDQDLVDAFDEASKAGILIEEPGGYYRFNHALVRQSLLAELASVRRMRLHQRIATTLESQPGADDDLLAELAHHYYECAWAGNAAKAVEYCRRAADEAMARLAYEGAADLYDHALHALEEIDHELPDREEQTTELLVARCEALLAAGDVASAAGAVTQLKKATRDSARLAAWATCFDGQLSMLTHPERLDETEAAVKEAADKLAELDDAAGEAKAHTVRAACLARLGRIGDCEVALDHALTAARRSREHRQVNEVLAGAPLAALWGPNPVPRAGGRCLDVVRLLRITTDSPAVEATSTRCQAVLEAFRGRAAAARRMIDSARRTVTELGLRHSLLEIEQFAGIVELIVDDPCAAEPHLRKAYNGFRRMGLDADTAETAALLGRTCLALDRDAEADELCSQSEELAGHAFKAAIAWRTLRAHLLSRRGEHDGARRAAEAAIALAERTDALVDHGDACLALATVLSAAGHAAEARAAAERAASLYEQKGAAALADRARHMAGKRADSTASSSPAAPDTELDNACVRVGARLVATVNREAWDEVEQLFAPEIVMESRRRIVGFTKMSLPAGQWPHEMRRFFKSGMVRYSESAVAVRGERLALILMQLGTADMSPGAPQDEMLQVVALDDEGRIAMQVSFDVDDLVAAIAELDTMHARFEDESKARRLDNAASQLTQRFWTHFLARDWNAVTEILADNICVEDRRPVVNYGLLNGPASVIEALRMAPDMGVAHVTSAVIAIRGERLALVPIRFSSRDLQSEAFHTELLNVVEINTDNRISAIVVIPLDDVEAAFAELDARYLAGEAAAHAHTWSVIVAGFAALNRMELPPTTKDWVNVDRRRLVSIDPGGLKDYLRTTWNGSRLLNHHIKAVHLLSDLGAVVTQYASATSQDSIDTEWENVALLTVDDDLFSRCELFDESDLVKALARFDELHSHERRLENEANRGLERYMAHFRARDWGAMSEILADDFTTDDRRRVVNAGIRRGRDAEIANMQFIADVGILNITSTAIATRGERHVLARHSFSMPDWPDNEIIDVVEINDDNRLSGHVIFDADDISAAFEELDARYLAGEAAAHAPSWSLITRTFEALNKHEITELPATTPSYQVIDHRLHATIDADALTALFRATWELTPDLFMYIEAVNRLDDHGVVITQGAFGTSEEGFDAQWRMIQLLTVQGEMGSECELFDEADLDAALARFEELRPTERRLENSATRIEARYWPLFAARDWTAMAALLADDVWQDDRRPMVGAGVRRGRDAQIQDVKAIAEIAAHMETEVIAIRGERLALSRVRFSNPEQQPGGAVVEVLSVVETDSDDRMAAIVVFGPDDIGAAFEELDARYLAGEAAPHAHTWSVVAAAYAAVNRHELFATTPDWANIDHRRGIGFAPGEMIPYIRASWDVTPDLTINIEAVHRVSNVGAVVTHATQGTSQEGFDADWRVISLLTVKGDLIDRCERFDEADADAALARFDELSRAVPQLTQAASQIIERFHRCFAARDWDGMATVFAEDYYNDDRRRVVNAGVRHGRDAAIEDLRGAAEVGLTISIPTNVIATRGERLSLLRFRVTGRDQHATRFDMLPVVEINADDLIASAVTFDPEDIDAAFEELDARYFADEAAAHAPTWSLITNANTALNRRELFPTTTDYVIVDHRPVTTIDAGNVAAGLDAGWDLTPDVTIYIEAVHRLTNLGVVVTWAAFGTSQEGFDAEWRIITVSTVERDLISRSELFDEQDLEAALTRFEELSRPAPRLQNAATRAYDSFLASFAARNWEAVTQILAEDHYSDDRRRVIGAGVLHGRDAEMAGIRATADLGVTSLTSVAIAIRGNRLALCRVRGATSGTDAFDNEVLRIVEVDAEERITTRIAFDVNDIEAAHNELDARYLTGEAAAHARTWSAISTAFTRFNRHELPDSTPEWVDHRLLVGNESGDLTSTIPAAWDMTQNIRACVETVHRLTGRGAVITQSAHGTSREGFDFQLRIIDVFVVDGDVINRCEMFDESNLDAALARFDELSRPAPRLEGAAMRIWERLAHAYNRRDRDGFLSLVAVDGCLHDRRKGLHFVEEGSARHKNLQAILDLSPPSWRMEFEPIAIRGSLLSLIRLRWLDIEDANLTTTIDALTVMEVGDDGLGRDIVTFDPDDIDAAFAELDARYVASEAAPHARTWSLITEAYAMFQRGELAPTTQDWVSVDHRLVRTPLDAKNKAEYVRAVWDLTPNFKIHIEAVHRLNSLGAVITHFTHATSKEGFEAEWHDVNLLTLEGDLINRSERFDESDLDGALARFEEISRLN